MDNIPEAYVEWKQEFGHLMMFFTEQQAYEMFESAYLRGKNANSKD